MYMYYVWVYLEVLMFKPQVVYRRDMLSKLMKYAIFSFSVFLVIVNEIRLKNNNCIVYD